MNAKNKCALAAGAAQGAGADDSGLRRNATSRRWEPAPGTQRALVLHVLRAGHELTAMSAWKELGVSRLAADVHALRRMGWAIEGRERSVPCRGGRQSRVMVYRLQVAGHEG
jgi:hypothetical protein